MEKKYSYLSNHIKKMILNISNPLFKNSIYIMLSTISTSGIGFIFWMLAAKLYSQEDLGIATALISSITLLITFSRFGLDQSVTRFLPERDHNKLLTTTTIAITVINLFIGVIFILGIEFWAPKLTLVKDFPLIYLIFLITTSLASFAGTVFISLRVSKSYFIQSILMGVRVILLYSFINYGALGIFSSVGISYILTLLFSIFVLYRFGLKPSGIDYHFLKSSFSYSLGNYIVGILASAPNQIIPLIILNMLGTTETAQFYIVYSITVLILIVPSAFSLSLFVEGSHGENLKKNSIITLFVIFSLLTPTVVVFWLYGDILLGFIDKSYVASFSLLRILSISSFFSSFNLIYTSIKKVQKKLKHLIYVNTLTFILLLGLSYILIPNFGLMGVGYAWVVGYCLSSIVISILLLKEGNLNTTV